MREKLWFVKPLLAFSPFSKNPILLSSRRFFDEKSERNPLGLNYHLSKAYSSVYASDLPSIEACDGSSGSRGPIFMSYSIIGFSKFLFRGKVASNQEGFRIGIMIKKGETFPKKPPPWPDPAMIWVRISAFKNFSGSCAWYEPALLTSYLCTTDCCVSILLMDLSFFFWSPIFFIYKKGNCLPSKNHTHPLIDLLSSNIFSKSFSDNSSLVFCVMDHTRMDKGKQPLEEDSETLSGRSNSRNKTAAVEKIIPEGGPCPNDGNKPASQKGKKAPKKPSVEKLKSLIEGVQENISLLSQTALYATFIGTPIEAKEIRFRIKKEWRFLKGGFQLVPNASNWFELWFDQTEDCDRVWKGRSFHIAGQLLLLRQWKLNFNPATESITRLDLWVRFPSLPVKFISNEVLSSIAEKNGLGKVLKVAAFNPKGARLRYPRVCVSVDITLIPNRKVYVVDENDSVLSFPIWFEDFSSGCGSCGDPEHLFEECPKRKVCNSSIDDANPQAASANPDGTSAEPQSENQGEWIKVARKKAKELPPPRFGNPKELLFNQLGCNANMVTDSSSSKSPEQSPALSVSKVPSDDMAQSGNGKQLGAELIEKAPLLSAELPHDANNKVPEKGIVLAEFIAEDDGEITDFGDDLMEDDFEAFTAGFSQDDFEVVTQFEQLEVDKSTNSESRKRKVDPGDDDTASSMLKGAGGKKLKHAE